jgi:hypothetical protein
MGLLVTSVICFLIGAALSLRFKVIVLFPATIITLFLSWPIMIAMGFRVWQITICAIAEITALQTGYLAGAMLRHRRVRHRRASTAGWLRRSRINGDDTLVDQAEPTLGE